MSIARRRANQHVEGGQRRSGDSMTAHPGKKGRRGTTLLVSLSSILLLGLLLLILPLAAPSLFVSAEDIAKVQHFFEASTTAGTGSHTNNWAVLVCASRFWFNYRHMANTLGMYRTVKRLGLPDSNIILMLADDAACNSRNRRPGSVWGESSKALELYGNDVEVDYRGNEVSVENLLRLLTGRVPPNTPRNKRLDSDARSNIFFYMTGHGGDEFLKFQDHEEISAYDVADAIEQMWQKKRYNEMFFMVDTCQANTMYTKIYSPNVLATGSSRKGQNSYSHNTDFDLGIAMIDRFTNHVLEYMEHVNKTSEKSMQDLFDSYDPAAIHSDPGVRTDLYPKDPASVRITDFFGGVAQVELT